MQFALHKAGFVDSLYITNQRYLLYLIQNSNVSENLHLVVVANNKLSQTIAAVECIDFHVLQQRAFLKYNFEQHFAIFEGVAFNGSNAFWYLDLQVVAIHELVSLNAFCAFQERYHE